MLACRIDLFQRPPSRGAIVRSRFSSPLTRGWLRLPLYQLGRLLTKVDSFHDPAGITRLPDDPHMILGANGKRNYKIDERVVEDIQ
jgi:hypothetical protein